MSVLKTAVELTDKIALQNALVSMATMFPGMTHTTQGEDVYVHYAGIEQYRKQNLVFRWNGKLFEPVGDNYNTKGNLNKVMAAVPIHYRRCGVKSVMGKYGSCIPQEITGGIRLRINR
jgi:hypothetical protein